MDLYDGKRDLVYLGIRHEENCESETLVICDL